MSGGDAAIEITMKAHEGYANRISDKEVLDSIHRFRKSYPKEDPFLDAHRMLRIYEDEAQRRKLRVPGGAYRSISSNPKRNAKKQIVQKPTQGRKLQATMQKRREALAKLERKAFARLRGAPLGEENPHVLSARGQVDVARSGRARAGAMALRRQTKVAKELKAKRTRRALAALNPSEEGHQGLGDEQWNRFQESYDRWSIGKDPGDLLDAFEAATLAEMHYQYAGVDHAEDGSGAGPAGAEAEGVRREILELEQ